MSILIHIQKGIDDRQVGLWSGEYIDGASAIVKYIIAWCRSYEDLRSAFPNVIAKVIILLVREGLTTDSMLNVDCMMKGKRLLIAIIGTALSTVFPSFLSDSWISTFSKTWSSILSIALPQSRDDCHVLCSRTNSDSETLPPFVSISVVSGGRSPEDGPSGAIRKESQFQFEPSRSPTRIFTYKTLCKNQSDHAIPSGVTSETCPDAPRAPRGTGMQEL